MAIRARQRSRLPIGYARGYVVQGDAVARGCLSLLIFAAVEAFGLKPRPAAARPIRCQCVFGHDALKFLLSDKNIPKPKTIACAADGGGNGQGLGGTGAPRNDNGQSAANNNLER
jgi:hypothetical protein